MNRSAVLLLVVLAAACGYLLYLSYLQTGELALADERLGALEKAEQARARKRKPATEEPA